MAARVSCLAPFDHPHQGLIAIDEVVFQGCGGMDGDGCSYQDGSDAVDLAEKVSQLRALPYQRGQGEPSEYGNRVAKSLGHEDSGQRLEDH